MKIERISENQIRCTLTRDDLAARDIRLSELAYGSEKTKLLFQDMMQQAFRECGFEVNNTPLMIEAIPVSTDSIILIITKVEDPEELDSRFSRFSPEANASGGISASAAESLTGVDDILDLISRISQARKQGQENKGSSSVSTAPAEPAEASGGQTLSQSTAEDGGEEIYHLSRFYLFRNLENIIRAAKALDPLYAGSSSLYKNPEDGNYYLILRKEDTPADLFNKVCNILSEYGLQVDYMPGIEQLFFEHMEILLKDTALASLRTI